jgi:hypothetical protein
LGFGEPEFVAAAANRNVSSLSNFVTKLPFRAVESLIPEGTAMLPRGLSAQADGQGLQMRTSADNPELELSLLPNKEIPQLQNGGPTTRFHLIYAPDGYFSNADGNRKKMTRSDVAKDRDSSPEPKGPDYVQDSAESDPVLRRREQNRVNQRNSRE